MILSKSYKSVKNPEISTIFSILLLVMPIFANVFPVDWYHSQEYNIVQIIKIIKYIVISWFGVEICHIVRPTQTSILAASTRMSEEIQGLQRIALKFWALEIRFQKLNFRKRKSFFRNQITDMTARDVPAKRFKKLFQNVSYLFIFLTQ